MYTLKSFLIKSLALAVMQGPNFSLNFIILSIASFLLLALKGG